MRILHTSDWHLGHQLLGVSREYEQQCFLDWLFEQLQQQNVDSLIVAGDIFDSANPPAWAWRLLYQFLAKVKQQLPRLDLLLVAGNHDSPSKLDAPDHLLRAFDIHLIGSLPRLADNSLDYDKLIIELTDGDGEIAARVAAVPFLRPGDLDLATIDDGAPDKLVAGVERIYQTLAQRIKHLNNEQQASIATAHAYLVSSQISEMSERRILGGNQHALPVEQFALQFDYTALGHLHKPQQLAGQAVYYSGSPIPLSLSERTYKHQVKLVEFRQGKLVDTQSLIVPRRVELLKVPSQPEPLEQVLDQLRQLEKISLEPHLQPLLEVHVLLEKPQSMLREQIVKALAGKNVRLVKITTHYVEQQTKNVTRLSENLDQIQPEQVFRLKYQQQFNDEAPAHYLAAFNDLLVKSYSDES